MAHCSGCGGFTLAFGTAMVTVFEEYLKHIYDLVDNQLKTHKNRVCPNAKAFLFNVSEVQNLKLVLTYTEMVNLQKLLDHGLILLEAQQILDDASN